MASSKGKDRNPPNKPEKKERFNGVQFINYNLTDEQKKAVREWNLSLDQLSQGTMQLVDEHFKVTLKYDDYSKAYACFVNPDGPEHPFTGWILTGRGSSPLKALKQALYIHFTVFEGNWLEYAHDVRADEIDD
jgi:hypothetical protein